LLGRQLS